MKNKSPQIRCPNCNGAGHVGLSDGLLRVLNLVKKHKEITATAIHLQLSKSDGVIVTAINNRLEDLRLLGLVERRRNGKQWIYTPTKKQ